VKMGNGQSLKIYVDEDHRVQLPGHPIHGRCVVELTEEVKIKGFNITFSGIAKTHWTEEEQRTRKRGGRRETYTETVSYGDSYQIFSYIQDLTHPGDVARATSYDHHEYPFFSLENEIYREALPQGISTFPFMFTIPKK
jgi:hypothetical protein